MGNGTSNEAHSPAPPPQSFRQQPNSQRVAKTPFTDGEQAVSSRSAKSALPRPAQEVPTTQKRHTLPPLTEVALRELGSHASDVPVPQTATARLSSTTRKVSQPVLKEAVRPNNTTVPKKGAAERDSALHSPHPPDGNRPPLTSPPRAGGQASPMLPSSPFKRDQPRPPSASEPSGQPAASATKDKRKDGWFPAEFGPVLPSPTATDEDHNERYEDQKTMFYQLYVHTHGGSVTNRMLQARASAAMLIREREKLPKGNGLLPTESSPSPSQSPSPPGDRAAAEAGFVTDPVDVDKYVTALYTFSREKTKTTFFIDQDGEMRRLFHTSGWHRLPTLNSLAVSGSNASLNSSDSNDPAPTPAPQPTQKTHRGTKSASSANRKKSGTSRKAQEAAGAASAAGATAAGSKRHKTRPRSSSIRSNTEARSFTSASQWSLGSQPEGESAFFTSQDVPPVPQPILVRTSSFRRTSSTSSLKYLAEAEKANGACGGTGELPTSFRQRTVRSRVSFTANTPEFRAGHRAQPPASSQAYSYDWDDDEEEGKDETYRWGAEPPPINGARTSSQIDALALLKGKMRT